MSYVNPTYNVTFEVSDGTLCLDLCPRDCTCMEPVDKIILGLMDIRAVNSIRITFDFPRNGWKIEQQKTEPETLDEAEWEESWIEVAFISGQLA